MCIVPYIYVIITVLSDGTLQIDVSEYFLKLLAEQLNCAEVKLISHYRRHFKELDSFDGCFLTPRIKVIGGPEGAQKTHILLVDFIPPFTRYVVKSILTALCGILKTQQEADEEPVLNSIDDEQIAPLKPEVYDQIHLDELENMANQANDSAYQRKLAYLRGRRKQLSLRLSQMFELTLRPPAQIEVAVGGAKALGRFYIFSENHLYLNYIKALDLQQIRVSFYASG